MNVGPLTFQMVQKARTLVRAPLGISQERLPKNAPLGLGPRGMELLHQTLAQGGIDVLVRAGGWKREVSLDGKGGIRTGRVWERHPDFCLRYSDVTFKLLRALLGKQEEFSSAEETALGTGDELLCYLASKAPDAGLCFASAHSVLCWLAPAKALSTAEPDPVSETRIRGFLQSGGDVLIEALTAGLAQDVAQVEMARAQLTNGMELIAYGTAQQTMLERFCKVSLELGRPDLMNFMIDAVVELYRKNPTVEALAAKLRPALEEARTLRERQSAGSACGALLRVVARLRPRYEAMRVTRHFEDGFDADQAVARRWRALGRSGFAKAAATAALLETIEPLT